jgi:hypothetical protein
MSAFLQPPARFRRMNLFYHRCDFDVMAEPPIEADYAEEGIDLMTHKVGVYDPTSFPTRRIACLAPHLPCGNCRTTYTTAGHDSETRSSEDAGHACGRE